MGRASLAEEMEQTKAQCRENHSRLEGFIDVLAETKDSLEKQRDGQSLSAVEATL